MENEALHCGILQLFELKWMKLYIFIPTGPILIAVLDHVPLKNSIKVSVLLCYDLLTKKNNTVIVSSLKEL